MSWLQATAQSHIGGLNYVTPEMSGFVTGAGNADADTAAIQWALNQNAKQVVLDSTKTYNIQPRSYSVHRENQC
ncbi:hypothetical protein LNP74_19530 [Klebsiella pneumoniae subsp. pneumoniae]|nr:hypothetical protein [Klebsiella pneumoniae subsp. pneumoniae]